MTRWNQGSIDRSDVTAAEDAAYTGKRWAQMSNPTVQEAIRVAIQRLSKNNRSGVTKKHILKVLFLARERLPDGNPVKQDLAYYWYKEGPYSEVVYANLNYMVADGLVKARKTNKSETYSLVPEHALQPVASSTDLDMAKREIALMASKFFNLHDAVKRTYEMAPFKWYRTYNLHFKPQFESYCKDALADRESTYTDRDMLERLDDAVLDYPTIPEFLKHRAVFMDFAKIVNAFLRRDLHRAHKDTLEWISDICSDIWETFAYGVRVHNHDSQYDSDIEKWTEMYNAKLDRLDRETVRRMEQFGDVGVDEPDLDPEIKDMILHPERYEFTPLSLDEIIQDR